MRTQESKKSQNNENGNPIHNDPNVGKGGKIDMKQEDQNQELKQHTNNYYPLTS